MAYERKTFDLIISEELKAVLSEIESDSQVARLLLKKRHDKEDLVDNPVNFISISREDRTKLSYLTSERMEVLSPTEYWTSSRRFQAKPGGFISKVFKNVTSREVEKFSNLSDGTKKIITLLTVGIGAVGPVIVIVTDFVDVQPPSSFTVSVIFSAVEVVAVAVAEFVAAPV